MNTPVKIAIIGAGSAQFSAGVVRDLCVNKGLHKSHVALMDVDSQRLEKIARLASRLSAELNAGLTFSTTTNRQEVLKGADFVINTAAVGGHDYGESLRRLAEAHGYYRGIGFHSLSQMAFFLDVARDMERICPNAWLVQSANPVFEGCTLIARETKVKTVGLCHGHYGYGDIARVLGLDLKDISVKMPGFNHWIWLTEFRYKGEDAYPLLDKWIETKAEDYWAKDDRGYWDQQMSRAAIHQYKLFGLMPIGDTPRMAGWWYQTDLETKKHWYGHQGGFDSEIGWGQYLGDMQNNLRSIEKVISDETTPATKTFTPVQSDEQIVPIINSIVHNQPAQYQVNIPNSGILDGFPQDLVVECQATVDGSGIIGIPVPPLPSKLTVGAMIPRWQKAEALIEIVRTMDRDSLLLWILADQRTRSLEQAEGLMEAFLNFPQNGDWVKGFRR